MSQAKRAIRRGCLKRNKYTRMSQAQREICRGCLMRNERFVRGCIERSGHVFEGVSSEASYSPAPARGRSGSSVSSFS
eukprot:2623218-Pyramimonas_sp.AAC.1